jgi:hypothetical protein
MRKNMKKNMRRDSSKKFTTATRKATKKEKDDALLCWYTYDIYLENGKIKTIQETSDTYEMVAAFYRMTKGDEDEIIKIERITKYT